MDSLYELGLPRPPRFPEPRSLARIKSAHDPEGDVGNEESIHIIFEHENEAQTQNGICDVFVVLL